MTHSRNLAGIVETAVVAEELGFDSVWVPEAYGSDAVTVLSFIAARTSKIQLGTGVLQLFARTPANTAMTAMALDELSHGRLLLGIGSSGPQVVEGWHGVPFDAPVGRTREYVDIVRTIVRREAPLSYQGRHYAVPLQRDGEAPLKAMRSSMHPFRPTIPIYVAANGPRNVALTAELADGWLPFLYSPEHHDAIAPVLEEGLGRRDPSLPPLTIASSVAVHIGDDLDACRDAARPVLALYIGGMGTKERNFYNDLVVRYGYASAAAQVQDLYLSGRVADAERAIPTELVDLLTIVGPPERVKARLRVWADSPVDQVLVKTPDVETLRRVRALFDEL